MTGAITALKRIFDDDTAHFRWARAGLWLILVATGLIRVGDITFESLENSDYLYSDLVQLEVMMHAVIAGFDPYSPTPDLIRKFFGVWAPALPHPSPYPAIAMLLAAPFVPIGPVAAHAIWVVGCVLLVYCAFKFALGPSVTSERRIAYAALLTALTVSTPAGWRYLYFVPLNGLMLCLLLYCWPRAIAAAPFFGGLVLGFLVSLKWFGIPFLFYLLVQRRPAKLPLIGAFVGLCSSQVVSALMVGLDRYQRYLSDVGPSVTRIYFADPFNFGFAQALPKALGLPLFLEQGSFHMRSFEPASIESYWNMFPVAVLATLAYLAIVLLRCRSETDHHLIFFRLTVASFVTQMMVWHHTFIVVPILVVYLLGCARCVPKGLWGYGTVGLALFCTAFDVQQLIPVPTSLPPIAPGSNLVLLPLLNQLLLLIPTLAFAGLALVSTSPRTT